MNQKPCNYDIVSVGAKLACDSSTLHGATRAVTDTHRQTDYCNYTAAHTQREITTPVANTVTR